MDWNSDMSTGLTGTSVNQLGHMVRLRIVRPAVEASRRGVSHRFDFKNLVEMTIGAEFFDAGITALNVARAIAQLHENWSYLCDPETRDQFALLILFRSRGKARPTRTDLQDTQVDTSIRMGPITILEPMMINGDTVHAAINVGWIIGQLEQITKARCAIPT